MGQAYYRKWRPLGWDAVVGQNHVVQTLQNALSKNRIAHAYLFSGPRGTGKTSTARIVAKAVNCLGEDVHNRPCNRCDHCEAINSGRFLDLIEIDAASNTSVDDVRSLREKINFSPSQGRYKVYIIDEVHMLSTAAFNALLKTLEEPPTHAIFILATTEVHKIPATVLSRCQRHEFRRIPINSIQASLRDIIEKEEIEVDPAALTEIARQSTGSLRDAVSLLDQLASTGNTVTLEFAKNVLGTARSESVKSLTEAVLRGKTGQGIKIINEALDSGSDPRQFGRQVVDYLRAVLMVKMGNKKLLELSIDETTALDSLAKQFDLSILLKALRLFDRAAQATSFGWQPGLQLELAVAGITQGERTFPNLQKDKGNEATKSSKLEKTRPHEKKVRPAKKVKSTEEKRKGTSKDSEKVKKKLPELKKTSRSQDTSSDSIQSNWKEIRRVAKSISPETGALMNSCKTTIIRRGRLVLGFSSGILQSKMQNGQNIEHARTAIKQVTGIEIEIDCEVTGKEKTTIPGDMNVDQDGMLGTALSLGGKMTKQE